MFELVLVFHLIDMSAREPVDTDFRTLHIAEASYDACERERAWWAEHYDRQPPGWDDRWELLIGPACQPIDGPKSPGLVG